MENNSFDPEYFFRIACYFEGLLIIVALVLGLIAGINPFAELHFTEAALGGALLATLPPVIVFLAMRQLPFSGLRAIKIQLQETLGAGLHGRHWTDLLVLSAIAGCSEELLFRGVLQPWLENAWSMDVGLIVSNLIFALFHAVTPLYGLLALLMGLYLGLSLDYGGERSLLIPIVIHTLYDFVAFIVILRDYRESLYRKIR